MKKLLGAILLPIFSKSPRQRRVFGAKRQLAPISAEFSALPGLVSCRYRNSKQARPQVQSTERLM